MMNPQIKSIAGITIVFALVLFGCRTTGEVVQVTSGTKLKGLDENALSQLEEIRQTKTANSDKLGLKQVLRKTPNYTVDEYLSIHPDMNNPGLQNYKVGGYDILDIAVYEEDDLSRKDVPVSADGFISFPLLGRVKVAGRTPSDIEELLSLKLSEGQYLLDAHIAVTVMDYRSKQFMVLGSVKEPGNYPLKARERVLDAISKAGGIDFEQGGKQGMIIRTENPDTSRERKVVIRIDLPELLKGGGHLANLLLYDRDLLYIPKAENFYVIGQVQNPGSYPYLEKEVTIVEALIMAGGFTQIAARNKTRIIRLEDGMEKIIQVQVDAITGSGKKGMDVLIKPGDVIVVPESFF